MHLKVKRPSNYDMSTAIMLGPVQPDPSLDTSQLVGKSVGDDNANPNKVRGRWVHAKPSRCPS